MSQRDFTIETLARLLQRTPQDVRRMVERDKIPGRKVGGEWSFPRAEILEWLAKEIDRVLGSSDAPPSDEELGRLRRVLTAIPVTPTDEVQPICIADMLIPDAIGIPFVSRTRASVFPEVIELAMRTGFLWDSDAMLEAIKAREELYSTALESGVALLHPRHPMPNILSQPFLALGVSSTGIHFAQTKFGQPTDIFFLIASVDDRSHLQTLARLSRILTYPEFLENLRAAEDAIAAHQLIAETEAELYAE